MRNKIPIWVDFHTQKINYLYEISILPMSNLTHLTAKSSEPDKVDAYVVKLNYPLKT
jgi:hypothetical protein